MPRVVSLGEPRFVGAEYLSQFSTEFKFSVLEAYDHDETVRLLAEAVREHGPIDAFVIRMGTLPYEPFDQELLAPLLPSCRIVASASAGYNEFPVDWLAENGVFFTNTLDAVAEATADMAMFLTLAVLRNTSNAERSVRQGTWRNPQGLIPARDPYGLTLGIVGMGSIGKYHAKKAAAFNLKIFYHNRRRLPAETESQYGATYCASLHELLAISDIVALSVPLNADTTNMIGPAEFAAMKDGVFLVNTARGAVVDEDALISALESGKVARAGLDVFANEPNPNPYFLRSDKVVVQPHLGGLTDFAFHKSEKEAFENIRALFRDGKPNSPVRELRPRS